MPLIENQVTVFFCQPIEGEWTVLLEMEKSGLTQVRTLLFPPWTSLLEEMFPGSVQKAFINQEGLLGKPH